MVMSDCEWLLISNETRTFFVPLVDRCCDLEAGKVWDIGENLIDTRTLR